MPIKTGGLAARDPGSKPLEPFPEESLRRFVGSLKKRWKRYRRELKCCRHHLSEKAIHDFRVEARRLLSGIELLAAFAKAGRLKEIERSVKEHLDMFDDLRDTQVQLQAVDKLLRAHSAARPFAAYLAKCERRFTKQTRECLERAATGRLGKLIAAYRQTVKGRLRHCGPAKRTDLLFSSVARAFERTRLLRASIDPGDPTTIHRIRVAFKKFRYMVEALAGHLPGMTKEHLERMHDYQTMMGEVQDARVLLAALDKFLRKKEIEPAAASRFRTELLRRRQWSIRIYLDAADQLLEFWPLDRGTRSVAGPLHTRKLDMLHELPRAKARRNIQIT